MNGTPGVKGTHDVRQRACRGKAGTKHRSHVEKRPDDPMGGVSKAKVAVAILCNFGVERTLDALRRTEVQVPRRLSVFSPPVRHHHVRRVSVRKGIWHSRFTPPSALDPQTAHLLVPLGRSNFDTVIHDGRALGYPFSDQHLLSSIPKCAGSKHRSAGGV